MTLTPLYHIHDALETALRELDKAAPDPRKVRRLTWRAHDRLERVIVRAQAGRGK